MKTSGKYILNENGNPVEETDLMKWSSWFETSGENRRVSLDQIGEVTVSTVFLGLDHSFAGDTPVLYETMTFGAGSEIQDRYATKDEALNGHLRIVEELKSKLK